MGGKASGLTFTEEVIFTLYYLYTTSKLFSTSVMVSLLSICCISSILFNMPNKIKIYSIPIFIFSCSSILWLLLGVVVYGFSNVIKRIDFTITQKVLLTIVEQGILLLSVYCIYSGLALRVLNIFFCNWFIHSVFKTKLY